MLFYSHLYLGNIQLKLQLLSGIIVSMDNIIAPILLFMIIYGLYMLILYIIYCMCFKRDDSHSDLHDIPPFPQMLERADTIHKMLDEAASIPFQEIQVKSFDGLNLYARYYETMKGAPIVIQFHGYRGAPLKDFCGGLPFAINLGYNVILVEQRAHGKSEGKCLTFGVLERKDVLSWIDYAKQRFGKDVKISLMGISMGAATVLTASDIVPSNVTGIMADCGFTSASDIIRKVAKDRKLGFLSPLLDHSAKVFAHFDIYEASAESALRNCKVPVLLIHGEADTFVPCEMSIRNYRACASEKQLVTVKGADHAMSYFYDNEAWTGNAKAFLERTNPIV